MPTSWKGETQMGVKRMEIAEDSIKKPTKY
jgi:hypothetical protein